MFVHKLDVHGPDALVLSDGQSTQCAVKRSTGSCDETLIDKELTVVNPDSRHLWCEKTRRVCDTMSVDILPRTYRFISHIDKVIESTDLMHKNKGTFKCVVDIFKLWMSNNLPMDLFSPQLQVIVP